MLRLGRDCFTTRDDAVAAARAAIIKEHLAIREQLKKLDKLETSLG